MVNEPSADKVEQDWQRWWDTLPAAVRKKLTGYEESLDTKLTWNQRYLLVMTRRGEHRSG